MYMYIIIHVYVHIRVQDTLELHVYTCSRTNRMDIQPLHHHHITSHVHVLYTQTTVQGSS